VSSIFLNAASYVLQMPVIGYGSEYGLLNICHTLQDLFA
jgi:hypothetical protein